MTPPITPQRAAVAHPVPMPHSGDYVEHWLSRDGKPLYVRDYPGPEPALVLMHGFPDSLDLYDRLVPYLTGRRRVVLFDFIGWGRSDQSADNVYSFANLTRDLDAVIRQLGLHQPDLVAHDASGPPAIEWAIDHPDAMGRLVLLNTFYMLTPRLRPPEGVLLYMLPGVKHLVNRLNSLSGHRLNQRLYHWQLRRFVRDRQAQDEIVPYLFTRWHAAWPAFRMLVGSLFTYSISRALPRYVNRLRTYGGTVRIIFGARDPYLNVHVARRFHALFPHSELFLLERARHYVQVDEPRRVADLLLLDQAQPVEHRL